MKQSTKRMSNGGLSIQDFLKRITKAVSEWSLENPGQSFFTECTADVNRVLREINE